MSAFLLAAHEAGLWADPIAPEELLKLVCWDTDTPRQ
jgi:hypothetical protein